jgi:hypothetical protein
MTRGRKEGFVLGPSFETASVATLTGAARGKWNLEERGDMEDVRIEPILVIFHVFCRLPNWPAEPGTGP